MSKLVTVETIQAALEDYQAQMDYDQYKYLKEDESDGSDSFPDLAQGFYDTLEDVTE